MNTKNKKATPLLLKIKKFQCKHQWSKTYNVNKDVHCYFCTKCNKKTDCNF